MNAKTQTNPADLKLSPETRLNDFLTGVGSYLLRDGQEAITMELQMKLNGQLGLVTFTFSIKDHPVNLESNRVAQALLDKYDQDNTAAVEQPRAQPFDPYSGR
jgi:hypothetical protein